MSAASGGPQRGARRQWYASRFSFLRGVRTHARPICLVGFMGYLAGCGSAPAPETFSSQPVSDLSGHWEVDYAQSDSVQTQINARFREVQREMRRRQDAIEQGARYQARPVGDVDTLIALAKMAELVTEPSVLTIEQDQRWLRIERDSSFALTCRLDEQSGADVSQLGAEWCWWDGRQWHFAVQLPEGLLVEHRFVISEERDALAQRTVMSVKGTGTQLEVMRVFARYDNTNRGYRCTETLSKGLVCTTESADTGWQP